jgi:hypothetical protein
MVCTDGLDREALTGNPESDQSARVPSRTHPLRAPDARGLPRRAWVALACAVGVVGAVGGLATPEAIRAELDRIEPDLYRYPAIDPPSLRAAVDQMLSLFEG